MEINKRGKMPAPYGQSCAHCVKAKSRCMLLDSGTCERCHRLNKDCIPSSGVRKKSAKNSAASKRSQLEDKLDDLVSVLRTQRANPQQDSVVPQSVTAGSLQFIPQPDDTETICDQSLTEEELTKFCWLHLPHFPLIFLPPDLSATQMEHEKPLLSLAIKTICNKAYSSQAKLSKKLRETIAMKMMVDGEKSLDLLLSILTCMSWSIYFTSGKQFLGMLAGLARSLVSDLRLDKPPKPSWCPAVGPYEEDRTVRSNESRRAHIACFALSTTISATFKYDMMPWSPQLEQDCSQLAISAETDGDELLVAMARISRVCLQVADVSRHLNENDSANAALHIAPLLFSLDQLSSTFSAELSQHYIKASIIAFTSTARISIYELLTMHVPTSSSLGIHAFDHRRVEYLTAFLQLCKQCTEQYLSFDFINITTPTSVVFTNSLRNLYKLSTLTDAGWDPSFVLQTVNIVELLDLCAAGAEKVDANIEQELGEHSVFAVAAKSVRESAPPSWRAQNPDPHDDGDAGIQGFTKSMELPFVDFSDDFWSNSPFYL